MADTWSMSELDRRIVHDLSDFLPNHIFDAHAHLYRLAKLNRPPDSWLHSGPAEMTIDGWRHYLGEQVGTQRLIGALFMMDPIMPTANVDGENAYLLDQLGQDPHSRGLLVISPDSSPAHIAPGLTNPQILGFKPYHTFSNEKPTMQSSIAGFLPEWAWQIADEQGLIIMLHMVKDLALADPDNQRTIRQHCQMYPRAKLILAHAARGFHAPNTVKGLRALHGLQNVWFDMSGVCEATAIKAILNEFGPRKLMFGSDFPVCQIRGRCVSVGDGFAWLEWDTVLWDKVAPTGHPTLVGLESLRALKEAVDDFGLNEEDVQDIFCDNALRLLEMRSGPGTLTQDLYRHARQRLPGGTQLLSKRPEMMAPEQWPAYFREARGCETWDLDGRHYYDMSYNGIGANLLGFRDPDVTRAVQRRIALGSMCTLNPPEEVELADRLCEIHPWAEQVRFARCGGESGAVAVRIARATTHRSLVAICGYHGWQDWYLAANLGENDALSGHLLPGLDPLGVPPELRGTALTFAFNDIEAFESILKTYGDRLAAVIMEPCRSADPAPGFLHAIREGTHRVGALLIIDEITIGWRLCYGGAHLKFGIQPDMAIFAKALGNGHPIAAVIGTKQAMSGAHGSFISSTYWTESVGPVAALATLEKMSRIDVPTHVAGVGRRIMDFWQKAAAKYGLPVVVEGYPCLAHFRFDHPLANELRTLYTQLMLERGFLAGTAIYATLAHTDEIVSLYGRAIDDVFGEIADALGNGEVQKRLKGPVAHTGFRRLVS